MSDDYQVGGSLPADVPTYITRQADQDLDEERTSQNPVNREVQEAHGILEEITLGSGFALVLVCC